jgi:DNA primase
MEIQDIKTQLTIKEILQHYQLYPDKQNRLCCPFHDDKTPSLQVYYKTQTAYCFSSNCTTHGKSMDVIDFIMHMEKITKHEAIEKAKSFTNGNHINGHAIQQLTKQAVLTKMFSYFKNAVHNSQPAKEYLQTRCLDFTKMEVGYNAGQFHHGTRKDEALIKSCIEVGLLQDVGNKSRTGDTAYNVFGKWCIVFALKDKSNHVSGLYFRSTLNDKEQRHFYLKDRSGLYPCYPKAGTKKLILTESVIDAATLLQVPEIAGPELAEGYSVLALYGTNGLTAEHQTAIKELQQLEEIILWLNADDAGNAATQKHRDTLQALHTGIRITCVHTPAGEDINSIAQSHDDKKVFIDLLNERNTDFSFSIEKEKPNTAAKLFIVDPAKAEEIPPDGGKPGAAKKTETKQPPAPPSPAIETNTLDSSNPHKIKFTTATAKYYVQGGLRKDLDSLKITLVIENPKLQHIKSRLRYDLYNDKEVERNAKEAAEKLNLRSDLLQMDISILTDLLEAERDKQLLQSPESIANAATYRMNEESQKKCLDFLHKPNLIKNINSLIGKAGVVGEETNRIFLFVVASSYMMKETMHILIQGSSGSGKTRLLKVISSFIPLEDRFSFTRVTDSSFYNYPEFYLCNKLLCFEDFDGIKEDAQLAVRELMSNGILTSSTSGKDEGGNIHSLIKTVRGPITSIACTTKGEIYEDNISRCFVIAVDESKEQTLRIIKYQNDKAAGIIDTNKEESIKGFLQNCMRLLQPCEVINPYANKINLPEDAHKIRRLNELYQSFVKQITLLNQYQRKKDEQGRLITEKEDLQIACEIMFESIVIKVDELDGSLRQFYEKLKAFVQKQGKEYEFNRFEIMAATGVKKTQEHYYINRLTELEYLKQYGFKNKGFKYKIAHWDNIETVRSKIKTGLQTQLTAL